MDPSPRRQRHGHADGLHVSRRHVNDQAPNVAIDYGLEVITDGIDVPVVFELNARLQSSAMRLS